MSLWLCMQDNIRNGCILTQWKYDWRFLCDISWGWKLVLYFEPWWLMFDVIATNRSTKMCNQLKSERQLYVDMRKFWPETSKFRSGDQAAETLFHCLRQYTVTYIAIYYCLLCDVLFTVHCNNFNICRPIQASLCISEPTFSLYLQYVQYLLKARSEIWYYHSKQLSRYTVSHKKGQSRLWQLLISWLIIK